MNKVLAAERMSEAQLVEARTKADVQRIEAQAKTETQRLQADALAEAQRLAATVEAETQGIRTQAEVDSLRAQDQAAQAYTTHPALLRLRELETLRELAKSAQARIYIGFDKHRLPSEEKDTAP